MRIERCDLIDLDESELHFRGQRGEMTRMKARIFVLQEMQKLDQQIALARPIADERAHLGNGVRLDLATARKIAPAASARPGVNLARRVVTRLGHAQPFNTFSMVEPRAAGESVTVMPALRIASFLCSAVPVPPEMIAPACPMRRPGGAVAPAMNPTIGFLVLLRLIRSAASSSAEPPISPIMMIDCVSGSARNISRTSMKLVPLTGSPPMPTQLDWPSPAAVVCATAS